MHPYRCRTEESLSKGSSFSRGLGHLGKRVQEVGGRRLSASFYFLFRVHMDFLRAFGRARKARSRNLDLLELFSRSARTTWFRALLTGARAWVLRLRQKGRVSAGRSLPATIDRPLGLDRDRLVLIDHRGEVRTLDELLHRLRSRKRSLQSRCREP